MVGASSVLCNPVVTALLMVVLLLALFMPSTLVKLQANTVGRLLPSTKASFRKSGYATFDQTATMGGLNDQVGLSNAGTVMNSCGVGSPEWGLSHDTYGTSSLKSRANSVSRKKKLVMNAGGMSDHHLQAHL